MGDDSGQCPNKLYSARNSLTANESLLGCHTAHTRSRYCKAVFHPNLRYSNGQNSEFIFVSGHYCPVSTQSRDCKQTKLMKVTDGVGEIRKKADRRKRNII